MSDDLGAIAAGHGSVRIVGNAHSHIGHFLARASAGDLVALAKGDIVEASPVVEAWLAGFLAGSEPSLSEFAGGEPDVSEDVRQRWLAALVSFRETGQWLTPMHRGLLPVPHGRGILDPWAIYAGGVVRWSGDDWQPWSEATAVGTLLEGSVCARRGYHDLEAAEEYVMCTECGYVEP